jgi:hypothetical protein
MSTSPSVGYGRVQDILNIQTVIPISLDEDWLLISRWITPVVYQPNIFSPAEGAMDWAT